MLEPVAVPIDWRRPPGAAGALIAAARRRVERFDADPAEPRIPALVHSDFAVAWNALRFVADNGLADGRRFCEWGSGFGVVTCLAALLGFDACGIEVEPRLVAIARDIAAAERLPARFVCGDYRRLARHDGVWTAATDPPGPGFPLLAHDLVYVYPWPAEERHLVGLFERHAAPGTLLVSYHGGARLRVRRQHGAPRTQWSGPGSAADAAGAGARSAGA